MSYVPHPADEPLVRRPAREVKGMDEQAERNRTSALEPSGQGSDLPGLRDAPVPELAAGSASSSPSGPTGNGEPEETHQNLRHVRLKSEIESGGPLSEEARRQLEQNIVPNENYP